MIFIIIAIYVDWIEKILIKSIPKDLTIIFSMIIILGIIFSIFAIWKKNKKKTSLLWNSMFKIKQRNKMYHGSQLENPKLSKNELLFEIIFIY